MFDVRNFTAPENQHFICPVIFAADHLPGLPSFINEREWTVNLPARRCATVDHCKHSFPIYPRETNLPFHTGVAGLRQHKSWAVAVEHAARFCKLVSEDESLDNTRGAKGKPLKAIGLAELKKSAEERFITFAINVTAYADEKRILLITLAVMIVILFDDAWEGSEDEKIKSVQTDLINRLRHSSRTDDKAPTPLQKCIDEMVEGFHAADDKQGNGGQDVLNTMVDWILHDQPKREFTSMEEYLDYRWLDAGNAWLLACTKFSINSSVDLASARLAHLQKLAGNHVCLANDLASFEKELREFNEGESTILLNAVNVMRKQCGLSIPDAKVAVYTLQLLVERDIQDEIDRLDKEDVLSAEEWRFVDAVLVMIAGNVFFCMASKRYGGEAARIRYPN